MTLIATLSRSTIYKNTTTNTSTFNPLLQKYYHYYMTTKLRPANEGEYVNRQSITESDRMRDYQSQRKIDSKVREHPRHGSHEKVHLIDKAIGNLRVSILTTTVCYCSVKVQSPHLRESRLWRKFHWNELPRTLWEIKRSRGDEHWTSKRTIRFDRQA